MLERSATIRSANNRRGIQSVETGLRVLAALAAAGGPATLTSLGVRSGLSPSQTHRYLQSLIAAGMAVQDATSRYDLGPGMIRIGIAALARADAFARAESALRSFVDDTGWTAMLTVWGGTGPVCVRWLAGRPPVMTSIGVGATLPLDSAAAHVFLSLLPTAETEAALAGGNGPAGLPAIVAQVRTTLTARQDGVLSPGLRAIAVPMFDLQGRPVLVAAALAAAARACDDDAVAERLRQACSTATLDIGGVWAP